MLSRNIWYATELAYSCKQPLLQPLSKSNSFGYVRLQFRKSFHNSRRNRPVLEEDPLAQIDVATGPLYTKNLVRPFLFTIGVSAASVVGCAVWEYEALRKHTAALFRKSSTWLSTHQKTFSSQFKAESEPLRKWWSSLKDSEKVFFPILALNLVVFAGWKIKALQPFMVKYFCSNPAGKAICLPMVLSTFSHFSALHLAANMYVLYSFMPAAVSTLGKEQFVGMYLSAGVFSSLFSFMNKIVLNQPGLSLGASGAIMAVLAFVCVQYPETKLSIIFLPMYTFAAGTAFKAIMAVDLAGVMLGWKIFDHAAHLGGALFGIFWCHWGSKEIWGNRDKVVQYYHHFRKPESGR